MDKWSNNRLTVVGPKADVGQSLKSKWYRRLGARHGEMMENLRRRYVSIFETDEPPLEPLRKLSRRWPRLVFLLDYEIESKRIKGILKAQTGRIASCQLEY